MYKAIKDNKIIAISDTDSEFPCLVKDSVETDETHTIADYDQYNGEYLLKSEIPAPSHEEIEQMRIDYRRKNIDDETIARMRKTANGTWTEEMETAYLELDAKITAYIEENMPYPTDPITESEENADTQN